MTLSEIMEIFETLYEQLREKSGEYAPHSYVFVERTRKGLACVSRVDLIGKSFKRIGVGRSVAWGIDAHMYYLVSFGERASKEQVSKWFSDSMFSMDGDGC